MGLSPGRGGARAPAEDWDGGVSLPIPRKKKGVVCGGRKWLAQGWGEQQWGLLQWSDRAAKRGDAGARGKHQIPQKCWGAGAPGFRSEPRKAALTVGIDSESHGSKALNDSSWDNNLRGLLKRGRRSQNIVVLFYQRARRGSTDGRESLMELKLNVLQW